LASRVAARQSLRLLDCGVLGEFASQLRSGLGIADSARRGHPKRAETPRFFDEAVCPHLRHTTLEPLNQHVALRPQTDERGGAPQLVFARKPRPKRLAR